MNKIGKSANGTMSKAENPSSIVRKILITSSAISTPANIPVAKVVAFFFLIKSSVVRSLKFSFATVIYFDCDCRFLLATNGQGFVQVGN